VPLFEAWIRGNPQEKALEKQAEVEERLMMLPHKKLASLERSIAALGAEMQQVPTNHPRYKGLQQLYTDATFQHAILINSWMAEGQEGVAAE